MLQALITLNILLTLTLIFTQGAESFRTPHVLRILAGLFRIVASVAACVQAVFILLGRV